MRTYGLIGYPLGHSFSPKFFEEKFSSEGIVDAQYLSFPLEKIDDFPKLIASYNLRGLNVTLPYKRLIIPFLDELSQIARETQAVNCIVFKGKKLIGHNTDVLGFEKSLLPLIGIAKQKALILGTGGAAQAVAYVLNNLAIPFKFVSRDADGEALSYSEALKSLKEYQLIINTTPIGMSPELDQSPLEELLGVGKKHLCYDLIYNPEKTCFLQMAEKKGAKIKNGLEMLEIQALESWKLWQDFV
ncbi:MAG: shikimate dehydrogenase [Bacteroidetes bacterium]|nr:shikimate dehydrogenase [Bacteroidota bacterium]